MITQPAASAMQDAPAEQTTLRLPDLPTLAGIACVAYAGSILAHEGIGHGVTCALLGGTVRSVSTVACDCDGHLLSLWTQRAINAGGPFVNLALAGSAYGMLRRSRSLAPTFRYFWWLVLSINLFMWGGCLMVPTLIGFGDWFAFLQGLPMHWVLRGSLIALGVAFSFAGLFLALRLLEPFLGRVSDRRKRATILTCTPYLIGGLLACVAGAQNPQGANLILISAAAASLGGTCFLVWIPFWVSPVPASDAADLPLNVPRSWGWILAGALAAVVFIAVFGPGVRPA